MIGELFSKYEPGTKRTCQYIMAATCRDTVFHTIPTPTVCYSVPSIVEVSGGCQSVNIYIYTLRQRGIIIYYSEMICIIYAKSTDRASMPCTIHGFLGELGIHRIIAQFDPGIVQIHRLSPTLLLNFIFRHTCR